jgi:fructose-1,6-bisphosphatase/inositol monophosphatase family enzyme
MRKKRKMDFNQLRLDVEQLQKTCWSQVIKQYFNALSADQVVTKAHAQDFQTIADTESEKFLTQELQKLIPGSLVLGEEAQAAGQVSLDIFTSSKPDDYIWVIDPIDGTYNFVNDNDDFAIIVALVQNNETIGGWIYQPKTGDIISTIKGDGAYLNGKTTQVSNATDFADLDGYSPVIYSGRTPFKTHFQNCATELKQIDNLRSAGVHYLKMAAGQADFYMVHHSMPWDHLAGVLLFEEAGGVVTKWDGSPYKPSDHKDFIISANNALTHKALMDKFIKPIYP